MFRAGRSRRGGGIVNNLDASEPNMGGMLDASELNMDGMTANAAGVDGTGAGSAADAGHAGVGHADVSRATNAAGSARQIGRAHV